MLLRDAGFFAAMLKEKEWSNSEFGTLMINNDTKSSALVFCDMQPRWIWRSVAFSLKGLA